jgi:hypothetical protein
MNAIKALYTNGECPDCQNDIPNDVVDGQSCITCDHVFGEIREDDDNICIDNPDAIGESWQGDSDGTVGLD